MTLGWALTWYGMHIVFYGGLALLALVILF